MATFMRKTDLYETCPYNPTHRILQSRAPKHLAKCKKDHMDVDKKTCIFNAQHILDPKKYDAHSKVCPDRDMVDRQLFRSNDDDKHTDASSVPPPTVPIPAEIIYTEVWELNEKPVAGYIPNKNVLGPINSAHLKPAVKKLMYQGKFEDEEENAPIAKPAPIVEPKIVQPIKEMELLKNLKGSRCKLAANLPIPSAQTRVIPATSVTAELVNLKIGKGRGAVSTQK